MDLLLSVIVPCYNSEKYIERCINSIINQSYTKLEVIVIDDGSTDSSASIIKSIQANDHRVKYYYQENSGVSSARNRGLNISKGEYIAFVDSDDTIIDGMYEKLISLLIEYDADISHCSYQRVSSNNDRKKVGGSGKLYVMDKKEGLIALVEGGLFSPGACNKVFNSKLISNIEFNSSIRINEDYLFDFYAFQNANKTVFVDECFYEYHNEEVSSSSYTDVVTKAEDQYTVSKIIYDIVEDQDIKKIAKRNLIDRELLLYRVYKFYGDEKNQAEIKQLKRTIKDRLKKQELSGKSKIIALVIKWIPFLFKPVYKIYDNIRTPNWDI